MAREKKTFQDYSQRMLEGKMFPENTKNKDKIVLDLCGGTGAWSFPYRENGFDVYLIDIKNGHDVRLLEFCDKEIFLILAAPPCTEFSVAKNGRERNIIEGLSVVDACLRIIHVLRPKKWVLENPRGLLTRYLGPPAFKFNPCDFGDPWTKLTCYWGEFNEPIKNPVPPRKKDYIRNMPGRKSKGTDVRSITSPGVAKAFYEANNE